MIFNEAFDYLWNQLANTQGVNATRQLKDYERKRLRRALLARSIRSYFLEATWLNTVGTAGTQVVASTLPVTQPLTVLDGAIRTTDIANAGTADGNNFDLWIRRTAGNARIQPSRLFVKDEHILTPAQAAIRPVLPLLGQGACWPLTWPVPLKLMSNELLQVTSKVAVGGVGVNERTFCQFRAVNMDNRSEDDNLIADLRDTIKLNPRQKPVYLSMFSEGAHSITFDNTGATARAVAKTREAETHLLVLGYAALFARSNPGQLGSSANPRWRLTASYGHSFSKEEIDINTFAYAGPGDFWQQMPYPFLLPRGSSLSASFSPGLTSAAGIANELERVQNYAIFRCCTV